MNMPTSAVKAAPAKLDRELAVSLYRCMLRIRLAEETLAGMVERSEVRCPCHLYTGEEAVAAGVCAVLGTKDYVFGAHRSHGHYLAKGGSLREMMAEILGRVTGCALGRGGSMHLVAPEIGILGTVPIVAATVPMAAGAALASKLRGDGRVSASFFGDGAVEEGTCHEAFNTSAVHKLPVIFVCENNLYSSHLHLLERRAKDNIVDIAAAHGMPGVRVDGNDVVTVYQTASEAVERARRGEGPSFIECRTYRWRGHVGASLDLDVGVKRRGELVEWRKKDPIQRLKSSLLDDGVGQTVLQGFEQEIVAEINEALEFARSSPFPAAEDLGRYVFYGDKENR